MKWEFVEGVIEKIIKDKHKKIIFICFKKSKCLGCIRLFHKLKIKNILNYQ